MNKMILFLSILLLGSACSHKKSPEWRKIANITPIRSFIRSLSKEANVTERSLEKTFMSYLKNEDAQNWKKMGISKNEAKKITSLEDDLSYMPKVNKWLAENALDVFKNINRNSAVKAYEVMRGYKIKHNPYVRPKSTYTMATRRQLSKPKVTFSRKEYVVNKVLNLPKGVNKVYMNTLKRFMKKGKGNPRYLENGYQIIDSATEATRVTGRAAMGKGCSDFVDNTSVKILASKADVDVVRTNKIVLDAEAKYGKVITHYSEIPVAQRLTTGEMDDATVYAFKEVRRFNEADARATVKKLKRQPCSLY